MTSNGLSPRDRRVIAELVDQVNGLDNQLDRLARAQQARLTTIHAGDGSGIQVVDEHGNVVSRFGGAGSLSGNPIEYVGGPVPDAPAVPEVEPEGQGALRVALMDEPPADLAQCRVYASIDPAEVGSPAGSIWPGEDGASIGLSAGVWHVRLQWVTKSGKQSEFSGSASAEVEALVDVEEMEAALDEAQARLDEAKADFEAGNEARKAEIENLNEVTLPALKASLESAHGDLEQAFEDMASRQQDFDDSMGEAVERIANAEAAFGPIREDVTEAQTNARESREAAEAAEARAVEANNRAMTRLANGNFEQGLDYWLFDNASIQEADPNSGSGYVAINADGWIRPRSAFPVVEGQVWELSLHAKAQGGLLHATFGSVVDNVFTPFDEHTITPTVEWGSFGALRTTIPAGVDMLSFEVRAGSTGSNRRVDDVALRDVTDVVRLEEAAKSAADKAESAQEKADSVELALGDKADASLLPALETRLTEAFGEADKKISEDAAKDATSKADAAQQAAEKKADELAKAEAQAAQSAAEATAAADALNKANAARDAAIAASSEDATAKANAAKTAAEAAAAADAKAKADAAQAEAIRQAALDATAKADAAKTAAEGAAKDYADQQDATVKAEAAADAQTKADAVREIAESKASPEWVLSRGTDLVTNGTGYLNDNTNFTDFEFDPSDAPTGARGSFVVESNRRPAGTFTDETLPVDPTRSYMLSVMAREQNEGVASNFYVGLAPYDAAGTQIGPQSYSHDPLTVTELTEPLNPGDTTITVASTENFGRLTASSYVGIWDWVDSNGKTWPVGEYTRDYPRFDDIDGNTLILRSPYAGAPRPVGTPVSNNRAGGTYMYAVSNKLATNTWERTHRIFGGIHDTTIGNAVTAFPPATAAVRVMWLPNYGGAENSRQAFAAVSFSDATAALAEAEAAQAAADAAQARADEAHAEAGTAWTHADAAMSRAGAAETNAIEEAGRLATAAREAAAADATSKAAAAEAAAKTAAATDAQAKANKAKTDAEAAAKTYSDAVASGAEAEAIKQAKADATSKANAAETAAKAAAALDATAKAAAAQAEATRLAALDATTKANAAKAAAEATANNLPKVLHGTGAPSGTAPNGSIWWRHQGTLSGPVIGQWNRVSGQWRSTPISSEAIANLDVGKLTAGSAEIADAVIQKLYADVVAANKAEIEELIAHDLIADNADIISAAIKNLSVTERADLANVFAERLFADNAIVTHLKTRDAFVDNDLLVQNSVGAREINAESIFADEAVVNTVWAEVVRAGLLTAEEALIGGTLLKDDTIDASKINAESVTAAVAQFLEIEAGMIKANAVQAEHIGTDSIEARHISAKAIEADMIDAGAVDTEHLAARSIETEHINASRFVLSSSDVGLRTQLSAEGMEVLEDWGSYPDPLLSDPDLRAARNWKLDGWDNWHLTDSSGLQLFPDLRRFDVHARVTVHSAGAHEIRAHARPAQEPGTAYRVGDWNYLTDEVGQHKIRLVGKGITDDRWYFAWIGLYGDVTMDEMWLEPKDESTTQSLLSITREGLRAWDASGSETASIGGGGQNFITGRFFTNSPGQPGVVLSEDRGPSRSQGAGVWFSDDGSTGMSQAAIWAQSEAGTAPYDEYHILNVRAPEGGDVRHRSRSYFNELVDFDTHVNVYGTLYVRTGISLTVSRETSYNANIYIDRYGLFYRTSSASRYKLDQQVMDVSDDMLDLDLKDWIDKGQVDRRAAAEAKLANLGPGDKLTEEDAADLDTTIRRIPGVVAEDVEAIDKRFVLYNDDGQVENVMYDRLALAWIPIVRRQRDRIETLEAENEALHSKVDNLEARLAALEAKISD